MANKKRMGFYYMLSLSVAVTGCSVMTKNPESSGQYIPKSFLPIRVTQFYKNVTIFGQQANAYWSYCDDDCPAVTPKTIRIDDPIPSSSLSNKDELKTQEIVSFSADLLFDFGSSTISLIGKSILDDFGNKLQAYKKVDVMVVGYTDRLGGEAYNLNLSKKRAEAVKEHLSAFTDPINIQTNGRGKASATTDGNCIGRFSKKRLVDCLHVDRRVQVVARHESLMQ